jgi:hypothetical protein
MNVELRRSRAGGPLPAGGLAVNDNAAPRPVPPEPRALIYCPARSAMTSGRARTRRWVLEFEPRSPPFVEPLMGWTGSSDPLAGLRLEFPSREAALRFAGRQGIACEVRAPARAADRRPPVRETASRPIALPLPAASDLVPVQTLPGWAAAASAA